jgi:DNA/RNA-binding domain of Phe-tRNA-synthetase-like protein
VTNDAWPTIDPAIWALRPDYAAVSIRARSARNGPSALLPEIGLPRTTQDELAFAPWAVAHLEAWRDAFRAFGSKPQRTPCSAEALRKRVERDGALPAINAVVDLYNAISVRYAVPIGGEDMAKYQGVPALVRATGTEPFETMKDGAPHTEFPDAGEVVWRDDCGVTCRRWNWRQSPRTGLGADTTEMWFIVERLEPMPMKDLEAAGDALLSGLRRLAPSAAFDTRLLVR